MKKLILSLALLFITIVNCQTSNEIDNKFCIKTNPLALIDVYGGYSYRIGVEFKVHNNIAHSVEYGNYFNYADNDGVRNNSIGYIIKNEIKIYDPNKKLCSGDFISLEHQYKEIAFNRTDSLRFKPAPSYQKDYRFYKYITCFTLKMGNLKVYKNGFIFEPFFGLGVRICKGYNSLTPEEDNAVLTGENHGSEISYFQRDVNYVTLNLSLGFKVGYSFK